ncbi:hypothetical protein [Falsirhodobacter deserti]|uniref:hypothetical protein n=1 Tax=Falsirhodobacter deserti TaxID=1365611 RepID=UPI000FE3A3D3|nr:hypothetical protein [Falsirhodobacter deserti]
MAIIHTLTPQDVIRHDPGPVAGIYRDHGGQAARIVRKRLAALALETAKAADLEKQRDLEALPARLRQIAGMAADLGLLSLADAAAAAEHHLGGVAFPALWARVLRLTEAALNPASDLLQAQQ